MKKKINFGIIVIFLSGFMLVSCTNYPDESDYVTEQLVSISRYDTNINFKDAKYKYFVLADSATYVDGDKITRVAISGNTELQSAVNSVRDNLIAVGYTEGTRVNGDMGITFSVVKNTNYYVSYPWWWYSDWCYWDFWSCGWFPPYYPYPIVVGGYSTGTLSVDMFDLTDLGDTTKRTAMWTGYVRSLLTGTRTAQDIDSAIDDCFKQTLAFQK